VPRRSAAKPPAPPVEATAATAPPPKARRDIVARWGDKPELLVSGFVAIPVSFLAARAQLRPFSLTPAEALFVVDLMAHKWDERPPYPGYKRLAQWMGVSESYVRKLARSLERKRFLRRRPRIGDTNEFDLTPLFEKLRQHLSADAASESSATVKKAKRSLRPPRTRKDA
jgi:DNA-binding MarR family transcriptional regulator